MQFWRENVQCFVLTAVQHTGTWRHRRTVIWRHTTTVHGRPDSRAPRPNQIPSPFSLVLGSHSQSFTRRPTQLPSLNTRLLHFIFMHKTFSQITIKCPHVVKSIHCYNRHVWSYSFLAKCRDPFSLISQHCKVTTVTLIQNNLLSYVQLFMLLGRWSIFMPVI